MLATRLSRAQIELQAHRLWLSRFSLRRNVSVPFSTVAPRQQDVFKPSFKRMRSVPSAKRKGDVGKLVKGVELGEQHQQLVILQQQIREASAENDFDTAMTAYRSITSKRYILDPVLIGLVSQLRNWAKAQELAAENRKADRDTRDKVQGYAQELEKDIRTGAVRSIPVIGARLLQFFTYTQTWDVGMRFWKWLEAQDERHVDQGVYAAAIGFLAAQDTKLEDLETLFQTSLTRFPAGFAAYHFLPGAIVPDRAQSLRVPSLNLSPLLAILEARAMRGDAQNAYLALDAALRLRPVALDSVFFSIFYRERPIAEAFTVFAMACKAGIVPTANTYRILISSLRANADFGDARRYALSVKAMVSATHLYIGAGGRLNGNALTELVIVMTSMLRMNGCSALPEPQKIQLAEAVQELVSKLIALCARFDAAPKIAAFNSIITNLAGFYNVEEIATKALKDAQALELQPTHVTRRSLLVAAGTARNPDLIAESWKWLVEGCAKEGKYPDDTDLHILIAACVPNNLGELAKKTIDEMTHLSEWSKERATERLDKQLDLPSETEAPADVDAILAAIADIKADLEVFDERTSDARGEQDFSQQNVPMLLFSPPKEVRLPEAEMRKLYDELTTDPAAPPQDPQSEPGISRATKVPFSQLRYESWKYITYLLAEGERHNKAYINAVDAAIAKGEKPPQRNYGEIFEGEEKVKGVGLSDPPQEIVPDGEEVDVEKVRARIMELRKVSLPKA